MKILVWIMQKAAAVDMELPCDERVIQGTDYAMRKACTETLLSTLHKQNTKKNGVPVLICAILLAVSLGTLVGCSITKENTEDSSGALEIEHIK